MSFNDVNSVKTRIETIHLDYLCNNFNLIRPAAEFKTDNVRLDLTGIDGKCLFELKSRNFPENQANKRKRPISDFSWWQLWEDQIKNYEEFAKEKGINPFWIFLLANTEKELSKTKDLDEDLIIKRDIYVLPWDAYNLTNVTNSNQRYLGLARLKREYNFSEKAIKKGKLFIAENVINQTGKYFS